MINALDKIFKKTNIYEANYIYIYSDFRYFFNSNKKNPKKSVKSLLELFTKKGITCVIPAFSYTTSGDFILEKTRSKVGFLANFLMRSFKYERSEHPLFSFVSIGKNKKIVKNVGKSAFGKNSVHFRLYKKKTFFLNLFRPLKDGNTLVHRIEQKNNANYRYDKKFNTKVIKNKKNLGSNFKAYVRKFKKKEDHVFTFKKIYKDLLNKDFMKYFIHKNEKIFIYEYDEFYDYLEKEYNRDNNIFIKRRLRSYNGK